MTRSDGRVPIFPKDRAMPWYVYIFLQTAVLIIGANCITDTTTRIAFEMVAGTAIVLVYLYRPLSGPRR
jgi:hypothetical protein